MTILYFLVGLDDRHKGGRPVLNRSVLKNCRLSNKIRRFHLLSNAILKDFEIVHREVVNEAVTVEDPDGDFNIDDGDFLPERLRNLRSRPEKHDEPKR